MKFKGIPWGVLGSYKGYQGRYKSFQRVTGVLQGGCNGFQARFMVLRVQVPGNCRVPWDSMDGSLMLQLQGCRRVPWDLGPKL